MEVDAQPALSRESSLRDKENAPPAGKSFMASTASSKQKESSAAPFKPTFAPKDAGAEAAAAAAAAEAGCARARGVPGACRRATAF
jgi:hypothetical protein